MAKSTMYGRRSGKGLSKTLIFADIVTMVVAPTIGLLVEHEIIAGKGAGFALAFVGLLTRALRQHGPGSK